MDKNSKFKTGANIFQRYFDKKKISSKRTTYWDKTFMGHKRNLSLENNNLRKDKEALLDENDDLFDENKQLKDEKYDLLDENDQLRNDVDKVNEKLSRKKEKYKALKKKNKVLHGENENLRKENENLSKQNNYMRDLLSWLGILFDEDGKQISNNIENQQMCNPSLFSWTKPDELSLFNGINKSAFSQNQKPMPKISSQPLQKE